MPAVLFLHIYNYVYAHEDDRYYVHRTRLYINKTSRPRRYRAYSSVRARLRFYV